MTDAIAVLVDSATVLNSTPIFLYGLRYVKASSAWGFGVVPIGSWTTMSLSHITSYLQSSFTFMHFCIGAENGVVNVNSDGKEKDKASTQGKHQPEDFRPFFSIQPWSSWSNYCMLFPQCTNSNSWRMNANRVQSCHFWCAQEAHNVKKAKNWVAQMVTRSKEKYCSTGDRSTI